MNYMQFQEVNLSKKGFSLIELLIVMVVICILSALAGRMIIRTGNPADASQLVAGACDAAQADAIAAGVPTRVIICIDPAAGARYLRCIALLVEDTALSTPGMTYWKVSSAQLTLPLGTVFVNDASYSNATDTMQYDLNNNKQSQNGSSGATCTYMEFDPTGQISNSTNNIQWIFEHALENEANSAVVGANRNDLDGFIVRRLGKFVYFQSPGQISRPSS